jgi:hypothetical protein
LQAASLYGFLEVLDILRREPGCHDPQNLLVRVVQLGPAHPPGKASSRRPELGFCDYTEWAVTLPERFAQREIV